MIPHFIFYDARSGSTLLAKILVEKLGVIIPPEANFLPQFLNSSTLYSSIRNILLLHKTLEEDEKFEDWNLKDKVYLPKLACKFNYKPEKLVSEILRLYAKKHGLSPGNQSYFCFKKGSYRKHFRIIKKYFPECKFIYLIRDGRAVFNSKKNSLQSKTGEPFETNPRKAALQWMEAIQDYEQISSEYPEDTLLVKYEDLVSDQECILEDIRQFLGIEKLVNSGIHYNIPERYGNLHENVSKKPNARFAYKWEQQLEKDEINTFNDIAGEYLAYYGYKV